MKKATKTTPTLRPKDLKRKPQLMRDTATFMTDGSVNSAVVAGYLSSVNGGGDVQTLANLLAEQVESVAAGDLTQLEKMLLSQATALQAMFTDLALRAKDQDHRHWQHHFTTLALKCAAGSRQAITALVELRAPRTVMFAKQANVTSGPQQVNNGIAAVDGAIARAGEFRAAPNELLEQEVAHEQGLVAGTTDAAGRVDPQLEAVGPVHRPAHARGKEKGRRERLEGRPSGGDAQALAVGEFRNQGDA